MPESDTSSHPELPAVVDPETAENATPTIETIAVHEEPEIWDLRQVISYTQTCLEHSADTTMQNMLQQYAQLRGLPARIWVSILPEAEIRQMTSQVSNEAFRRFFNEIQHHDPLVFTTTFIYQRICHHLQECVQAICEQRYKEYVNSNVNAITDLPNGKVMEDYLLELISTKTAFSYGFFDIDRLKIWNASLTEEVVDRVLKELGEIINQSIRTHDQISSHERLEQIEENNRRTMQDAEPLVVSDLPDFKITDVFSVHRSGDEYNIALPQTNYETALRVAARILRKINKHIFKITLRKGEIEAIHTNKEKYFDRILNMVDETERDEKKEQITEALREMHKEGIDHTNPQYIQEIKARILTVIYPDVRTMLDDVQQGVYATLVKLREWNLVPGSSDDHKQHSPEFLGRVSAEFWKSIGIQLEDDKIGALAYIINNVVDPSQVNESQEINVHLSASMGIVDCSPDAFDTMYSNMSQAETIDVINTPFQEVEETVTAEVVAELKTLGNIAEKYVKINGRGKAVAVRRNPNDTITYCSMNGGGDDIVEEATVPMTTALAA